MQAKQKQRVESYLRVTAFVEAHPVSPPATYGEGKEQLDDVVARLTDHSSAQVFGAQVTRAELERQKVLARRLRDHHMRPIVAIARAKTFDQPGIQEALRMPRKRNLVALLAAAEAMAAAVTDYQPVFVTGGRPSEFLEQLRGATEAVRGSMTQHSTKVGTRVGARAGIAQELRRGRDAVEMVDSVVRVAFEGNDVVLARWRIARRIRALPSGGGTPAPVSPTASGEAPPAAA